MDVGDIAIGLNNTIVKGQEEVNNVFVKIDNDNLAKLYDWLDEYLVASGEEDTEEADSDESDEDDGDDDE